MAFHDTKKNNSYLYSQSYFYMLGGGRFFRTRCIFYTSYWTLYCTFIVFYCTIVRLSLSSLKSTWLDLTCNAQYSLPLFALYNTSLASFTSMNKTRVWRCTQAAVSADVQHKVFCISELLFLLEITYKLTIGAVHTFRYRQYYQSYVRFLLLSLFCMYLSL